MLSGHVMFTALVPYGSLSLPLFALRWIKLISLALDTGQSESIGDDMRSKSGIIQNSRFSKIVFLISRVHHQCYSSVSPLRAQNASTTSFVSRSHWSQSSQANNQYCPFLLKRCNHFGEEQPFARPKYQQLWYRVYVCFHSGMWKMVL